MSLLITCFKVCMTTIRIPGTLDAPTDLRLPVPGLHSQELVVVPFAWFSHALFSGVETLNGMTFIHFPYTREYKWPRSMVNDLGSVVEDEDDDYWPSIIRDTPLREIAGYAVVKKELVDTLTKTVFYCGNDSAEDTVERFMVAFCVSNADHAYKFVEGDDAVSFQLKA